MKFEHYALNVPDAVAIADWYVKHCRMKIVKAIDVAPHTRFLADETGRVVLEIYSNRAVEARFEESVQPSEGTKLIMMRDPFGMALQLCQRANPF